MKASFSFTLPEERDEFEMYKQAPAMAAAADEFSNWLRSQIKYVERSDQDTLEEVRKKFYECFEGLDVL